MQGSLLPTLSGIYADRPDPPPGKAAISISAVLQEKTVLKTGTLLPVLPSGPSQP